MKKPDAVIIQTEPVAVSVDDAGKMMGGASGPTVRKWIAQAGFPAIHIGSRVLVPVAAMRRWADENIGKTIEI